MLKPVMYLDIDDTLLSDHRSFYSMPFEERRYFGFAAKCSKDFLLWATENFEVRWLSWWCIGGDMIAPHLEALEKEMGFAHGELAGIRAMKFSSDADCCKTNGIEWDEHKQGRPFVWVEDRISDRERRILQAHGFLHCWYPCHVTEDPDALCKVWEQLRQHLPLLESGNR